MNTLLQRASLVLLIVTLVAASACACKVEGSEKDNPFILSVDETIAKARADDTGWVKVKGKVVTDSTDWGYVCGEQDGVGISLDACVSCTGTADKETLGTYEGKNATLLGRLWVEGDGKVALQECEIE